MHVIKRIQSFINRTQYFAPLCGGYLNAIKLLIAIYKQERDQFEITFKNLKVNFRATDEPIIKEVFADHEYEFLNPLITVKDVPLVLDIGAHIGTFGTWMSAHNPKAKIISVEADPNTFKQLDMNAAPLENWQALHGAASGEDGAELKFSTTGPSMSHRLSDEGDVTVKGLSLGTFIQKIAPEDQQIDLVKIDIEGGEEDFILPAKDLLSRIDAVVIEIHPDRCDTDAVCAALQDSFPHFKNMSGRTSKYPLLYYYR